MKKHLPFYVMLAAIIAIGSACSHKSYQASYFDQQTSHHRIVAILPAEMIFTGKLPKELSSEDILAIEENESRWFQQYLYNGILKHANTNKYFTRINLQDINSTLKILEDNKISIRQSWKTDDRELARLLGVDAIVRMRIQKTRYMSDLASQGIHTGRQIINMTGLGNKIPIPYVINKTNDIYASCNLVSDNQTLWNDSYKEPTNWNNTSDEVIESITDSFGRHFPYKQRR